MIIRPETRKERYLKRLARSQAIPVHVATVNFIYEDNVSFLARAAGCFGVQNIHVIGKAPSYHDLRRKSGSMNNFVDLHQYSNPTQLIDFVRKNEMQLICADLCDKAASLHDIQFDFIRPIMLVLGNESYGIPVELSHVADRSIYIPMNGPGICLNTSQAGNVILYEMARQYLKR